MHPTWFRFSFNCGWFWVARNLDAYSSLVSLSIILTATWVNDIVHRHGRPYVGSSGSGQRSEQIFCQIQTCKTSTQVWVTAVYLIVQVLIVIERTRLWCSDKLNVEHLFRVLIQAGLSVTRLSKVWATFFYVLVSLFVKHARWSVIKLLRFSFRTRTNSLSLRVLGVPQCNGPVCQGPRRKLLCKNIPMFPRPPHAHSTTASSRSQRSLLTHSYLLPTTSNHYPQSNGYSTKSVSTERPEDDTHTHHVLPPSIFAKQQQLCRPPT